VWMLKKEFYGLKRAILMSGSMEKVYRKYSDCNLSGSMEKVYRNQTRSSHR